VSADLPEAGQVGQIVVHPNNADLVYVAALGHPFGKNPERGVYRSSDGGVFKTTDGGDTWKKLSGGLPSGMAGRVGVAVSPANPKDEHTVYALNTGQRSTRCYGAGMGERVDSMSGR
jgi:hypothetical protein